MRRLGIGVVVSVTLGMSLAASRAAAPDVDRVFAKWNSTSTPGCAVGVSVGGKPVVSTAYGMADLEHDVRNTPETVFEAGSVSKQFTAAAVLLLARDGKLSLDDPVRKYIPELPDYPDGPLLVRHMLNHTSGLRDWGSIEAIAGWPRTSRVYTHAHVLEIVSRQRSLNFAPGTQWSYSNTGYNLAAMIVSRVSAMPFAEFTQKRLFAPVGMSHTSWRDDHTRIVKNRAIAYDDEKDGFHTDMPFERVYGNGGLLTTVGDLLKWNENFTSPIVGDAAFVEAEQAPGHFNDGRAHGYALGLMIHTDHGRRIVEHSGSTAGYQAHLVRYPDRHVSVAVLCNVASAAATEYAHRVGEMFVGVAPEPDRRNAAFAAAPEALDRIAGVYRDTRTGMTVTITHEKDALRIARGPAFVPTSATRFVSDGGDVFEIADRHARMTDSYGTATTYERVDTPKPTMEQLRELTGTYSSDEAETSLTIALEGDRLVARRRPDTVLALTPVYTDAFRAPQLGLVIFRRNGAGRVAELSVVQDRVWDLRFRRESGQTSSQ